RGGVPDLDRAEMRAVGIGVADALHDREVAAFPRVHQGGELLVQADMLVELQRSLARHAEARPQLVIARIGIGNEGIQPVGRALRAARGRGCATGRPLLSPGGGGPTPPGARPPPADPPPPAPSIGLLGSSTRCSSAASTPARVGPSRASMPALRRLRPSTGGG